MARKIDSPSADAISVDRLPNAAPPGKTIFMQKTARSLHESTQISEQTRILLSP